MESQPQNPEFRINPEIFHPCVQTAGTAQLAVSSISALFFTGGV